MKRHNFIACVCLMFMILCMTGLAKPVSASIVNTGHQKYKYKEYVEDLEKLEEKYADHCQVNIIGQSADKRNLYEVVIGNPEAEKHLLVIGNLHAREYMTIQVCMKQIEYYLMNYDKEIDDKTVGEVLDEVAIQIGRAHV